MLDVKQVVAKTPEAVSKIIGQEAVIILPAAGEVKVLNEVGSRLWELVDGQRTIAELAVKICDEYAITFEQAEEDALDFIQRMVERKLLVLV